MSAKVSQQAVAAGEDGQRLDNWLLARLKGVPRSHIYRLIRSGQVRINGSRAKPMARLHAGDTVRIPPVRTAERATAAPSQGLRDLLAQSVIYRDADIIGLNKPAGLAVHGGSGVAVGLIEAARSVFGEGWQIVHRLDRDTSGCLLLVARRELQQAFQQATAERRVHKEYLALLHGRWEGPERVEIAISRGHGAGGERMVRPDAQGKAAATRFTIERELRQASLMRAELETGRTHQIRVHAAHSGHPLLGDAKYGDRARDRALLGRVPRLCLHARRLALELEGRRLDLHAPPPEELTSIVEALSP